MLTGELINQLEDTISEAKRKVELNDALVRLKRNSDFIRIFEEIYFGRRAIDLVSQRGTPGISTEVAADIDLDIIAIGRLRNFLGKIEQQADEAEQLIDLSRSQIVELESITDDEGEE